MWIETGVEKNNCSTKTTIPFADYTNNNSGQRIYIPNSPYSDKSAKKLPTVEFINQNAKYCTYGQKMINLNNKVYGGMKEFMTDLTSRSAGYICRKMGFDEKEHPIAYNLAMGIAEGIGETLSDLADNPQKALLAGVVFAGGIGLISSIGAAAGVGALAGIGARATLYSTRGFQGEAFLRLGSAIVDEVINMDEENSKKLGKNIVNLFTSVVFGKFKVSNASVNTNQAILNSLLQGTGSKSAARVGESLDVRGLPEGISAAVNELCSTYQNVNNYIG